MPDRPKTKDLGKLVSVHATSPLLLQRASILAIVAFVFFLAMLIAFYIRQQIGYFILSTAFLVVNLFTMIGIWMQQRNTLKIYEHGIAYKQFRAGWGEITAVERTKDGFAVTTQEGGSAVLNPAIQDIARIAEMLRSRIEQR